VKQLFLALLVGASLVACGMPPANDAASSDEVLVYGEEVSANSTIQPQGYALPVDRGALKSNLTLVRSNGWFNEEISCGNVQVRFGSVGVSADTKVQITIMKSTNSGGSYAATAVNGGLLNPVAFVKRNTSEVRFNFKLDKVPSHTPNEHYYVRLQLTTPNISGSVAWQVFNVCGPF
jgi:hypothetical protein